MRISHKNKFIFFAFPKTGSSSVRSYLDPYSDFFPVKNYADRTPKNMFYPHIRPLEATKLFELYGWAFSDYHNFICVRNPWARVVSLFEHVSRIKNFGTDFPTWLMSIHSNDKGPKNVNLAPWRRYGAWSIEPFIADEAGRSLVKNIFKIENIDNELPDWLQSIGVKVECSRSIPKINVGRYHNDYHQYYSSKTVEYVARLYSFEIERFGYQFE